MPGTTRTVARTIAAILQDAQLIRPEAVEAALMRMRETGRRIGETLVELGFVTEEDLGWALAKQFGLAFVDVPLEALDRDLIRGFREGLLFSLEAVPLMRAERSLSVAVADPTDGEIIEALEQAAGCPVHPSVATRSAIRTALADVLGPPKETPMAPIASRRRFDVQWDRSGASFLLFHVSRAIDDGASEIHFVCDSEACHVLYRVGSRLSEVTPEPVEVLEPLLARIASLGGPVFGGRGPHVSGQALCPRGDHDILLDVSLLRHDRGTAIMLGLRPCSAEPPTLEQLGLAAVDLARIRATLELPAGLILVTGPARSGLTTTLGAMMTAACGGPDRAVWFEGRSGARVPAGTGVTLEPAQARASWSEIAVAQNADVVALSHVVAGSDVEHVLDGGGAGRRVVATTDWADTFALLEHLMTRTHLRSVLASRLQVVVQQRLVAPAAKGSPPLAVFELLHVTEPMRGLLRCGGPGARIQALAHADGYRPLADQLRQHAADQRIDDRELQRLLG